MDKEIGTELRKDILPFVMPVMAEQALITLMGLAGAIMATSVGAGAASAIGLVNVISNFVQAVISSLALGGTVAVARYSGSGSLKTARRAAAQSVSYLTLFGAILGLAICLSAGPIVDLLYGASEAGVRRDAARYLAISASGYPLLAFTLAASGVLRGSGDSRSSMIVNIAMNLINVVAGRVLIMGISAGGSPVVPVMGATGAAIALDIARLGGSLLFLRALLPTEKTLRSRSRLSSERAPPKADTVHRGVALSPGMLMKPGRDLLGGIMSVAMPAAAESVMFNGGKIITQTFLAGFGTSSIAADYLANSIASIAQVPVSSVNIAIPALVGAALGAGSHRKAIIRMRASVWLGSLGMAAVCIVCYPLAPAMMGAASKDPAALDLAIWLFRSFLIASPLLWALAFVIPSGLRGAGDGRHTMVIALISMWTARVGGGWLLSGPMKMGVRGIWIAMYLDWIVRAVFYVYRWISGKWLHATPSADGAAASEEIAAAKLR
ncbi:MAG: MATE family efflux transporter [Rectinemataceae bacterium]